MGVARAHDQARQRGVVDAVEEMIATGALAKFNVGPHRIRKLISYLYNVDPEFFTAYALTAHHDRTEEPNLDLEATYQSAYNDKAKIARRIEDYSHFGIFMFISNYHLNWVSDEHGRGASVVQQVMVDILFPLTPHEEIWQEWCNFERKTQPEEIWQFSRMRYIWAKDQWPNLSGRVTTIWTLQDFGLLSSKLDFKTVISVANGRQYQVVNVHMSGDAEDVTIDKEAVTDADAPRAAGG